MENDNLFVVGVGSSAGGLETLKVFIQNLAKNLNVAYIIVQHLSPNHKSIMSSLLSKESDKKVIEIRDNIEIKRDTIYITPNNKNIILKNNHLLLSEPQIGLTPKPSIDLFFNSLANEKKDMAIGVILSGTGSDGSYGIRAIKEVGGVIIAQTPDEAKYDGMPYSAISTGEVDSILSVKEIGKKIYKIVKGLKDIKFKEDDFSEILKLLYEKKHIDFSQYKLSTIERRVKKRLFSLNITNLKEYLEYLKENDKEVIVLFKDILIGVTSFFRDFEAFKVLKHYLINNLKEDKDEEFRVWVVGCSSGEEVYSIAILLLETIKDKEIKIFASDINEEALIFARRGIYPKIALIDMPKEWRDKYFILKKDNYQVKKILKDNIVWSKHDLIKDPPFPNLNLISCRNLLIYFNSELQKNVISTFGYVLKKNGILFLGKSENIGEFSKFFTTLNSSWKIFKSKTNLKRKDFNLKSFIKSNKIVEDSKKTNFSIEELIKDSIEKFFLPNSIIIDENMNIIFTKGELPYLSLPVGEVNLNIFKMLHNDLILDIRLAISEIKKNGTIFKTEFKKITILDSIEKFLRCIVVPIKEEEREYILIFFEEEDIAKVNFGDRNTIGEVEVTKMKLKLQNLIDELELSNREILSLNQEFLNTNEELQSSNEELETTNEELQSTNEELQTAYSELKSLYDEKEKQKIELEKTKDELEKYKDKLEERVDVQTKQILDNEKRFKLAIEGSSDGLWDWNILTNEHYFSIKFKEILGFSEEDELKGDYQTFIALIHPFDLQKVLAKIDEHLKDKREYNTTFRMKTKEGSYKWILSRGKAIFKNDKAVRMVGFITDIDKILKREDEIRKINHTFEKAQIVANIGTFEYDIDKDIIWHSSQSRKILNLSDSVNSRTFEEFINAVHSEDRITLTQTILNTIKNSEKYEINYRILLPDGKVKILEERAEVIFDEFSQSKKLIGVTRDVTQIKESEEEIQSQRKFLQSVIDSIPNLIYVKDWDGKFILVNLAMANFYNTKVENLIGKKELAPLHKKILKAKKSKFIEEEFVVKNGQDFYFQISKIPLNIHKRPKERQLLTVATDITKLKQVEQELNSYKNKLEEKVKEQTKQIIEGQERFKLAIKGTNVGLWDWNLKTNEIYFSNKWKEMLGFSENEIENSYENWHNLLHKDDIKKTLKILNLHLNGKSNYYETKFRLRTKSGGYKWVLSRGKAIFDENAQANRMVGFHIDIDRDVKQEIELNRVKKSFEEAQHIAHIGNWEWNIKFPKLWWSDEVFLIFDENPQSFEPTFEKFLEYIYLDDFKYVKKEIERTLREKSKYNITHRVILKSGKIKYVKEQGEVTFDDNGNPSFMIGTIQDITDVKKIELALEFNQKHLRAVLDTQKNIVIVNDGEKLVDANRAFFQFFDKYNSVNDFLKEHNCVYEFFEQNEEEFISHKFGLEWLANIKKEGGRKDKVLIKKEDKKFIFSAYSQNINFYGKNRNVIVFNDITELENYKNHLEEMVKIEIENRRKQENILLQQSKMASMGEMIGAIAHQWRQPLNNLGLILFNIYDSALEDDLNEEEFTKLYQNARGLINQMSSYIDDFRSFFKPSKKKNKFFLQKAIYEAISILSAQLKHNSIELKIDSNNEDIEIDGYENEFKHAILNLITNAKDVILEREVKNGEIKVILEEKEDIIKISVEDNGGGIEPKVIDRIFEPYFTTKDDNKGTGIGLYMSKMIIENNMGGIIYVENMSNGAKFNIEFSF